MIFGASPFASVSIAGGRFVITIPPVPVTLDEIPGSGLYGGQQAPPKPADLSLEEVQKSWDLLEIKLRNQAADAAPKVLDPDQVTGVTAVAKPLEVVLAPAAIPGLSEAVHAAHLARLAAELIADQSRALALLVATKKRQDDEEAFILMLCDEC